MRSHSAIFDSAASPKLAAPAAVTSTSIRPWSSRARATRAATAASSLTSAGTADARPPAARIWCAVASSSEAERAARTTAAPARANVSATARPMPRPPPVMRATRPVSVK